MPALTNWPVTFILVGTLSYVVWRSIASRSPPYPPGPTRLPIIGNIHLLPMKYQEKTFAEWGKTFGDIVFAKLFRTPAVIVNSYEVARDLMEKRSGNYSDRPEFTFFKLIGWENMVVAMHYGDQFRMHRKWMQNAFQTKAALDSYRTMQQREVNVVLANLLSSPHAFSDHFIRFSASTILEITYGHRVKSDDDEYIHIAEAAARATALSGGPGSMLLDFIPILKYLPAWMSGTSKTPIYRQLVRRMYDTPYKLVRKTMSAGTAAPSFTSNLLEHYHREGRLTEYDEANIKGAAAVIYAAGTETTSTAMMTFILAMVRHPEIYRKMQEEIDRVVGFERLPEFEDRTSLPYVESVIKESYRWNPPVPLGVPHSTLKPDVYRGYYIPQNTMVIGNIWAMSRDTNVYSNPEVFYPERYLSYAETDPKNIVFGFGRRQCPGAELADRNIFLLISNITATMNISKSKDAAGQEIIPPLKFTSGGVSRPEELTCAITPRSEKAIALIKQMNMVTEES